MSVISKNKSFIKFLSTFVFISCLFMLGIINVDAKDGTWSKGFPDCHNNPSNSAARRYTAYIDTSTSSTNTTYKVTYTWGIHMHQGDGRIKCYKSKITKSYAKDIIGKANTKKYSKTYEDGGGEWQAPTKGKIWGDGIKTDNYDSKKRENVSKKNKLGSRTATYSKECFKTSKKTVSANAYTYSILLSKVGENDRKQVTETITVPARPSYTVSYNLNGGTGTKPANQSKCYGTTLTLAKANPTKAGYTFGGWNTNAAGTGTNYASEGNYTANAGVTLYAKWNIVTYSITYKYKDLYGTDRKLDSTINPKSYSANSTFPITLQDEIMTGYTFDGWTTGIITTPVKNLQIVQGETGAKEFMAHFTPNKYRVKFNGNGGRGLMDEQEYTYDHEQRLPANQFKKKNYKFKGWNTESDGTGTSYTDEQLVKNLTAENDGVVTLYAQWEEDFIVTIDQILEKDSSGRIIRTRELEKDHSENYMVLNNKDIFIVEYKTDSNGKINKPYKEELESGDSPIGKDTYPKESTYELEGWVCTNSSVKIKNGDGTYRTVAQNDMDNKMSLKDITNIIVDKATAKDMTGGEKGIILKAYHKKKIEPKKCTVTYSSDSNGFVFGSSKEELKEGDSPSGKLVFPKQIGYSLKGWTCDKDVAVRTGATTKQVKSGTYMTSDEVKNIILKDSIYLKARFSKD